MAERIDVMISSTARDLPVHRQHAMDACVRQGMFPIMMEHLPASDQDAITASMDMVDEAEIYLGIVGRRYGYIPSGHDISITEMEYNRAIERDIPRLIFMMDDDHPVTDDAYDDPEKLAMFRLRLQTDQVVNFFSSSIDLRAKIITSLAEYFKRSSTTLARPSIIPAPPHPYVAHPYTLLETGGLFGRQQELKTLTQWFKTSQKAMMSLVAIGGMGKSSLTWTWFHEVAPQERDLKGRLWWSFYEHDAHYENFINRTLAYVSQQSEQAISKKRLPERESELLNILDQEPYLLALDGLERLLIAYNDPTALRDQDTQIAETSPRGLHRLMKTAMQGIKQSEQHRLRKTADPRAGAFLRRLAALSQSKVLISTRLHPTDLETPTGSEIQGVMSYELSGLEDEDAIALWYSFGCTGTPDALTTLFNAFNNYPLLLRALAGEVSRYRRAPGDFDAWQHANPTFNPYELPIVQRQSHILQFALTGLNDAQLQILRTVAAFNTPATYNVMVDLLLDSIVAFKTEPELDAALTELEDRGLLGWDRATNRYDLHPVVRGVIWNNLEETEQKDLYEHLRQHFEAMPSPTNWRKVSKPEDLNVSIELYHTLIGLNRYDEAADVIYNRLYRPLRFRLSDGQQLVTLLKRLFPDDRLYPKLAKPNMQSQILDILAKSYQMVGQPSDAVPILERANTLKEKISFTMYLSTGLRDLAYAQRLVGNLQYAEAAARRAVAIDRDEENNLLEALSLQVLGLALAARGKYDDSEKALTRSLVLAEQTNANRAYNHQAIRALWFGDHSSALDWSEKGIRYSEQRKLEPSLILAYRLQGEAALGLRELVLAENCLHSALVNAREVRLVEEEIASLIALANLRRLQDRLPEARDLLTDVWPLIEGGGYRLYHADAYNVLADIERHAGLTDEAIAAATAAYKLAWCDAPPYAYHHGLRRAETHLKVLNAPLPTVPPFDDERTVPMVYIEIDPEG